MTPPNAPTAAERAGEERMDSKAPPDYATLALAHLEQRAEISRLNTALLAARRERETAYETTAQVRDALSEEILKLRDHLAAARRENETAVLHLRTLAAHARGEPTDAMALNKAMIAALAAAHGEDR